MLGGEISYPVTASISILAVNDGTWIVLGVLVVLILAVALGLFTVRGSGISKHRHEDPQAPGAQGPPEESGKDEGEGSPMDQRGTR